MIQEHFTKSSSVMCPVTICFFAGTKIKIRIIVFLIILILAGEGICFLVEDNDMNDIEKCFDAVCELIRMANVMALAGGLGNIK